jgi:hypothetical protein
LRSVQKRDGTSTLSSALIDGRALPGRSRRSSPRLTSRPWLDQRFEVQHHASVGADLSLPEEVTRYGEEVTRTLYSLLPGPLVGSYFVGSVALGGYLHGRSDIDMVAVLGGDVAQDEKMRVAVGLAHRSLPCPTRGLELVLYSRAAVAAARPDAAFALNFTTGPGMGEHVGVDPTAEPRFWFLIDRAVARAHGRVITGPAPASLFAPLPRSWLLDALLEAILWHRATERLGHDSVLNAARAWRFAVEGVLTSKEDGAAWARDRWRTGAVLDAALLRRRGGTAPLVSEEVDAFIDHVAAVLRRQAASI